MYAICRWVSSSTRDWFLISGKCVWFLCLSTSRKFFIKQWSGGSTDMFCRGCSSECNVKDVLMNQIWIDFGPKLLRNFSGIYFKFLRETVLVSRCSALNVDNLRATDRCQVTTNLYGTFLKSLLYTLSTSQIKGTCKKWWGCMQFADGSQVLLETDSWSVGSVYGSYTYTKKYETIPTTKYTSTLPLSQKW